jgi:hypothetical protein
MKWKKLFWSLAAIAQDLGPMSLSGEDRPAQRVPMAQKLSSVPTTAPKFNFHQATSLGGF